MNKRVLIHTNHFYPETFRVNDIAFDLADKGYDVTVITSVPNYPKESSLMGMVFLSEERRLLMA